MTQLKSVLPILIVFVAAVTGCQGTAPPGVPLPVFAVTVTPLEGKAADQKDYVASIPALIGATTRPQTVVFFAFGESNSMSIRTTLQKLQDDYMGRIDFIYLDVNDKINEAAKRQWKVNTSLPTIIFLDDEGKELGRLLERTDREAIQNYLDSLIAQG
jgi:hypothetical protein